MALAAQHGPVADLAPIRGADVERGTPRRDPSAAPAVEDVGLFAHAAPSIAQS